MELKELLKKEQELLKRNQIISENSANVVLKVQKDVDATTEMLNKPFKVSNAAENDSGPTTCIESVAKPIFVENDWGINDKKGFGGLEAANKLLKNKVVLLQKEISNSMQIVTDKDALIKDLHQEIKNFQDSERKSTKALNSLKLSLERSESLCSDLKKNKGDLEIRIQEVYKELDIANREKKTAISEGNSKETRLNNALNEIEKLKQLLAKASTQVKESKDTYKSKFDTLFIENQKLLKQKGDLVIALKKQGQLIDVLKRQKMHLESVGLLGFTEQEFLKLITKE